MKDLKTVKARSTYKRVLLIGDSGSGKTTLIGTFPKPLVCDFDGKGENILAGIEGHIETYAGKEGWAQFKKDLEKWLKEGLPEGCQTLALDSLTFAADAVLSFAKNGGGPTTQAEWGKAIDEIKTTLGKLVGAPFHTVVTVHLSVEKDELLGGVIWTPSVYGSKLPAQIPAYFDFVLNPQISIKEGKPIYSIRTVPDNRLKILKNPSRGAWAAVEENPNFTSLINKLNKE